MIMPLKIWGRLSSINVQKAMLCVEELDLPHERVDAGLAFGLVNTPEYRAMNPNGLVPVMKDDDFVLWESNAIVRYLAAKHASGSLWPTDPRERADADRWMDWQTTTLQPAMSASFHGLVRTKAAARDPAAIEASRRQTLLLIDLLERHLSGRRWLSGDGLTMAEFALGPALHRWFNMPLERTETPKVRQWYEAVVDRVSARKVLTVPIS
jgi:glutathione S-transferase